MSITPNARPFKETSLDQLHIIIANGRSAKQLMLENIFFKDVLVPKLEEEITALDAALAWSPGSGVEDITKIGVDRVWKSGILFGMAKMWGALNKFKNDGMLAEKELGLRK